MLLYLNGKFPLRWRKFTDGFGLWKLYYSVDQIVKADKSACKDSFYFWS